jgi:hypothetical protein
MILRVVAKPLALSILRNIAVLIVSVALTARKSIVRSIYQRIALSLGATAKRCRVCRVESAVAVAINRKCLLPRRLLIYFFFGDLQSVQIVVGVSLFERLCEPVKADLLTSHRTVILRVIAVAKFKFQQTRIGRAAAKSDLRNLLTVVVLRGFPFAIAEPNTVAEVTSTNAFKSPHSISKMPLSEIANRFTSKTKMKRNL